MKRVCFISLGVFLSMVTMLGGCSTGVKESAAVEKYPVKPINVIVPYSAGGSADVVARMLERTAKQHLGQPFVVINKPGGAATVGMNELAGSSPDGYTIGIVPMSVMLQPLFGPTRYHYPTALDPLAKVVSAPMIMSTSTELPWKDINELVEYAKRHPGEIKLGHSGLGTSTHLTGELFAREAGINIVQVPFKGDSEALAALLGGHIQLMIAATPSPLKEHVKNGTVRLLGVATEKRLAIPGFETVPTFKEQGVNAVFDSWLGVAAPKGMNKNDKEKIAASIKSMVNNPEFKKSMEDIGMAVEYQGPDEFGDQWIKDNAKLTKIVKEAGIAELIAAQKK